jgi:type I restriction enzyme S subunit
MNSFGLDELNTSRLMSILESHSCISKAVIFGSRARNTFKVTSDIDIAIWTDLNSESLSLSSNVISSLKADFEDSLIPYTVDLIDYQQLSNQRLKEEIDRYGKVFYLRGWVETSLGEVCEKIGSGSTPRGGNEVYKNKGISLIRSQNVLDFDFSYNGLAFIDDIQASLLNNVTVLSGDILINITGDSVARVCMVPERVLPARVNQHVSILRTIKESLLPEFLKYYLLNPVFKNYLLILANSGGTRNALTKGILENLKIFLPPLSEQKAIAAVLSSLDDKIELLREQNKTLETIAQVLFKEWFVDFNFPDENDEPYKKSGGKMVESELGEIPEGWRVGKLGEEFDITIGRTPPRAESQWFSEIPIGKKWISIKDIGNSGAYIFSTSEYLTDEAIEKFNIPVIPANTTILSFKMTVGKLTITTEAMLSNEAIAHLKLKYNSVLSSEFIYSCLQNLDFNALGSTSSIVTAINSTMIKNLEIIIPDHEILKQFDEAIYPIFTKIKDNSEEIQSLTRSRNELLPRLMKGELRVSNLTY